MMCDDRPDSSAGAVNVRKFFEHLDSSDDVVCHVYSAEDRSLSPVTSGQLIGECRRWASLIATVPDRVVPIVGRSTLTMMSAWLGTMLAGKLPTYISYPSHKISPEDYAKKLANYVASFNNSIFVGESIDRNIADNMLTPEDLPETVDDRFAREFAFSSERTLFVQCSSGSTGLQKAVGVTTSQLESQLTAYRRSLRLSPDRDRIVSWLPLYHDMGLIATFLLPLMTRTPVVYIDTFQWAANPSLLLQLIQQTRCTLCWLPNFAFSFLCKVPPQYDMSSMRAFINCSEPVTSNAMRAFCTHHRVQPEQVSVSYALAENVFAATQTPIGDPPSVMHLEIDALQRNVVKPQLETSFGSDIDRDSSQPATPSPEESLTLVSCGQPVDGVDVRIDSPASDRVGEVLLRGSSCVNHYFASSPPRTDGWFPTGDLGFLHQGELYLCGRAKDVIIQNGKNIFPQDIEHVVNDHTAVRSGRTVAIGSWNDQLGSEQVVVLFEAEDKESRQSKAEACRDLRQQLTNQFNIQCEVHSVPRMWLKKTTSGKIARRANLEHFDRCRDQEIYLLGDSHVRLFWSEFGSHQDLYRRIHTDWTGVLHAGNLQEADAWIDRVRGRLRPGDVFVFQAGEPECRTIFPVADHPLDRIEESVRCYRDFFSNLREQLSNRIAYMTGPPTSPRKRRHKCGDHQWPINGSAEDRYRFQSLFYARMREMCEAEEIVFLDACSPLIEADGLMDRRRLHDRNHLHPRHREFYLDLFDRAFGFVSDEVATQSAATERWDGSYDHYLVLIKARIRELCPDDSDPDFRRLVDGGTLDSLATVELIATLEREFQFHIPLGEIDRHSFNSIHEIYDRFAVDKSGRDRGFRPLLRAGNDICKQVVDALRGAA